MTGFAETFGCSRGLTGRAAHERDVALALQAFASHQPCESGGLRVLTDNDEEPVRDGERSLYAFLTGADGALLAVSYRGEGAWRLKGMPDTLAQQAGIPRRFEQLSRMAKIRRIRWALIQTGVCSRGELLAVLELDEDAWCLIEALSNTWEDGAVVCERTGLDPERRAEVLEELHEYGLVQAAAKMAVGVGAPVALSSDGLTLQRIRRSRQSA